MKPRVVGFVLVLLGFGACEATSTELGPPATATIVAGDGQAGVAGEELPEQLVARVVDASGRPVVGAFVYWQGDGLPWADATSTSDGGLTRNYWSLGPNPGPQRLELWSYDPVTRERGILLGAFTATAH